MENRRSRIGKRTPLLDGRAKVTGQLHYVSDLELPGMLYARPIMSPYAHAMIRHIDKKAALDIPGVYAVITADDLPAVAPSSRSRLMLARERVIFMGQFVALVLAETQSSAADGAHVVEVDYEPLPAAITIDEAMAEGAPVVWPGGVPSGAEDEGEHGADIGHTHEEREQSHTNIAEREEFVRGDVDKAFAEADLIIDHSFSTPIVHQSSIETQGVIVQPNRMTGGATVWASTQSPFGIREEIADVLGVPESDVTVHAAPVGGAFGGKFGLYEELIALVAMTVGRPVKLVLTRQEELLSTNPAPPLQVKARVGLKKDGTLTAFEADVISDSGCYPSGLAGFAAYQMANFFPAPNLRLHSTNVLTFKPSDGAYRAPTAPTAAFVIDTLLDEAAERLGLDPLELKLKNAARTGDPLANNKPWPQMSMRETIEAAREHPLWKKRASIHRKGHGIGMAIGGWAGALEPGAAVCKLNRDGVLQVQIGSADLTGSQTSFALLAAEVFGVDPDRIRIVYSDTDNAPYAGGVGGSKTIYTVGTAVVNAAQEARRQVFEIASEELEAAVEDLEIVDGSVRVRGVPQQMISLGEIASKGMTFGGKYPPVHANGRQAITVQSPGFCAQIAEVEVDLETGGVRVLNLAVIQDVGRAINPMAVEGQMHGGAVQGIGWALFEEMRYDSSGQCVTGTFMDYHIQTSVEAPPIDTLILEYPSEAGPFGARGVGEPPVIPTAAAIANAIAHATGKRFTHLPITPSRIWQALNE
jgi:CO/xanthine dehydrogenase Mo-binding subunit